MVSKTVAGEIKATNAFGELALHSSVYEGRVHNYAAVHGAFCTNFWFGVPKEVES